MYLSRLILNPRSRAVRRDMADCQNLHRTVMSGFPSTAELFADPRARFGVLHRLDVQRSGRLILYVQSAVFPDWSRLPRDYLLPDANDMPNPAIRPLTQPYSSIRAGTVLTFRLRANPTRKIETKTGPDGARRNGRRVDLRREAEQMEWLRRKAGGGGFEVLTATAVPGVPDARVIPEPQARSTRAPDSPDGVHPAGPLTFGAVVFEGRLVVTDAARFRETLQRGIGPGKGYGFGLLSVAPWVSR